MPERTEISFEDYAIVACGTLNLELRALRETGFLNAGKILHTDPGRHEDPIELERQLVQRITQARSHAQRIIVVYGGKVFWLTP
jgi:hypothetical protein